MAKVTRFGVDETIRDLEALGREIIPKVGRPALEVGGKAAVALARAAARRRTGQFADSIHMIGPDGGAPVGGGALEGPEAETETRVQVVVGSALWYAKFPEFGGRHNPAYRVVGNAVRQVDRIIEDGLDHYMDDLLRELGFR